MTVAIVVAVVGIGAVASCCMSAADDLDTRSDSMPYRDGWKTRAVELRSSDSKPFPPYSATHR